MESSLDCARAGSASAAPSPPPSRFIPAHERTFSARAANAGASADFMNVSPVLPSLPASGTSCASASASIAGRRAPTDGVKSTNAQPVSIAASAYSALGGRIPRFWSIASISARGSSCAGCGSIGASVEETLTTTTCARSWRVRNAFRSVTMRASAACGSSRASRPVIPGRCSDSAASSAPASAPGRPTGSTPSSTRRAARIASGVSTTSWPPKTRSPSSTSPASANGGRIVTSPVGSASPAATAAAPVIAVVATDPRPPTSHTPTRRSTFIQPTLRHRTSVASCLSSAHRMPLYAVCQDQVC